MTGSNGTSRFRDRISRLCGTHPQAPIIQFEQRWTSWHDVARRTAALNATLRTAGARPTEAVAVVVRERPPLVSALLGLLAEGHPVVLVQSLASDAEIRADVGGLDVAAVVAEERDWRRPGFVDAVRSAGMAGVSLGDDPEEVVPIAASPTVLRRPCPVDPDVAVLVPTSGTSGRPRRHVVTNETLDAVREGVAVREPDHAHGVTISAVPLSSIGGFIGLVSTVWRGRPIALLERFDVDQWVALVREHRPRHIGVPPAIINAIVDRQLPCEWFEGVRSLTTGSAPLDVGAARRFADRYGIAVLNSYGATEFGGPVVAWRPDDWESWHDTKLGSVGRPLPGVEVRLIGADGDGDVLEVRKDGGPWTRTTDLARIDDDGFVWILGRLDDVIVRGGFKVSATDVENALTTHARIEEAVVVGIPDARLGSVPAAMVTLRPGSSSVTDEELRHHVRERIAPYKVPAVIRIVESIPRNAMMKPRRALIREQLGGER